MRGSSAGPKLTSSAAGRGSASPRGRPTASPSHAQPAIPVANRTMEQAARSGELNRMSKKESGKEPAASVRRDPVALKSSSIAIPTLAKQNEGRQSPESRTMRSAILGKDSPRGARSSLTTSKSSLAGSSTSVTRPPMVPKLPCATLEAAAAPPAPAGALPPPSGASAAALLCATSSSATPPAPGTEVNDPAKANEAREAEEQDSTGDDDLIDELVDEAAHRKPNFSPVRLRMGWRRNGELEVRTLELQHMLEVLRPGNLVKDLSDPEDWRKVMGKADIDATVRRFEVQQARLETLEREINAHRDAKHQALSSRAEVMKRLEEEKLTTSDLDRQLAESRSKLSRAQRQIQLLRNHGQPDDVCVDSMEKPSKQVDQKQHGDQKRDAAQKQMEQGRTYAPKINAVSASIAKGDNRGRQSSPESKSARKALPASGSGSKERPGIEPGHQPEPSAPKTPRTPKTGSSSATETSNVNSHQPSVAERMFMTTDSGAAHHDLHQQLSHLSAGLESERKRREAAEAAVAKAAQSDADAQARLEEVELKLQRMASRERDQLTELEVARKQAKDAQGELAFAKKVAAAAQLDAAQKADEARSLSRQSLSWNADRAGLNAAKEEAEIRANELEEKCRAAETALESIIEAPPPSSGLIKQQRKDRGIKDHPNAEAVLRKQNMAKLERLKLQADDEKKLREKVERELQRAQAEQRRLLAEQKRLQEELESALAKEGRVAEEQPASKVTDPPASAKKRAVAPGAPAEPNVVKYTEDERLRLLRWDVEETTVLRELASVEAELSDARVKQSTLAVMHSRAEEEKQLRLKAEANLERVSRISALQRAASEALQMTMSAPEAEDAGKADEVLNKALLGISGGRLRVSAFGIDSPRLESYGMRTNSPRAPSPRAHSPRAAHSPRIQNQMSPRNMMSPRTVSPNAFAPRSTSSGK